ncbi:probable serine/threonine-protein kinase SIS8 [Rutidosis leptorrhynchoides]|uniref:probable serine/threonine-protein kinase SIS8 n=1 Tax=Rutidosis leptorrhynchoides TaxID=125765 RepID=UPI003A9A4547
MKSLLKKLHIKPNSSQSSSTSDSNSQSGITGWLNSVTNKKSISPASSSNLKSLEGFDSVTSSQLDAVMDEIRVYDTGSGNSRDPEVEEEYQIQLALDLSAREDPEAVQIEAVKQISLGSCDPVNTPAEIVSYRYWNYSALSYDDKILDGFYDLYGILTRPESPKMPTLLELQETPVSDNVTWEAILVNKAADSNLFVLENTALEMAVKSISESVSSADQYLVQRLAVMVSDYMGGPVGDPDKMLLVWRDFSSRLKETFGNIVMPLGSLKVGLACHRALLFKVLADSLGIPCRLVKGKQYTGSNNVAMSYIKLGDGREYIVDLMADPGTLIPSDIGSSATYDESFSSSPWSRDEDSSRLSSLMSGHTSSSVDYMEDNNNETAQYTHSSSLSQPMKDELEPKNSLPLPHQKVPKDKKVNSHYTHARSPSWTEGISSPAVRKMKVKDVSQYMMEAAKENPQLAQKLHDVLLESGVHAPPDLFTEVYEEELPTKTSDGQSQSQLSQPRFLPPLPYPQRHEPNPVQYIGNVPAAAAAAAAAAAVASSMVVAATRTMKDQDIQLPVAAAATVTAAVVVATTTATVAKQYEMSGVLHNENTSNNNLDSPKREVDSEEQYGIFQEGERISDRSTGNESTLSEVSLDDVADCEIAWEDITLGERIGLGSYGEVYRGDWHGTDVAVKKFLNQEITPESLEEFRSEVRIMKRVRHPNVVLFMGAVTRAPHLSIVTEFLPRGSLYKLLRRPNNQLDYRRRLRMALDTARGMNYLHNCSPVIVHRDLKSPNLLVDKNWVVKVCDFGLSRMKNSTFLSSRSTAGTAEWMAPEVLTNEPSDEKCDVYSFGVILWELCTMQQPWCGMNAMQVVGAVGFQHRRLDIPTDLDPVIADIITRCWQTDPKLRPTFAEIMAALKPLLKSNANSNSKTNQE